MKKLFCNLYLKNEKAYTGPDAETVFSEDPVSLAIAFSDYGADGVIVQDLSGEVICDDSMSEAEFVQKKDAAHEKALDTIKEICSKCSVPVIGCGNINRMEDVKKLLYAGCDQVIMDLDSAKERAALEEVSKKFGKDKILGRFSEEESENGFTSLGSDEKKVIDGLICSYVIDFDGKDPCALLDEMQECTAPAIIFYDTYVKDNDDSKPEASDLTVFTDSFKERIRADLQKENICGVAGEDVNLLGDSLMAFKNLLLTEDHLEMDAFLPKLSWESLKKDPQGLVPCVVQDVYTGEVLMVAYMNKEAYQMTLKTGKMTYYSRSRNSLWIKGETSSHYQYVKSLTADCDLDTLLAKVSQVGAACHTGSYSCFFNSIAQKSVQKKDDPLHVFEDVYNVILDRKVHPREGSYTNYLFDKGLDKILKKVGEEATEIVIAAKNQSSNEVTYEISDFLYHMMVLMAEKGITWEEVTRELANR